MSKLSNNQGRGYEYACLYELYNAISEYRQVDIIHNSSLEAAKRAYSTLTDTEKRTYRKSAKAMIPAIFDCEPRIIENDIRPLELLLQKDQLGEEGDVRDLVIRRDNIQWEIGLSIKHNNDSVKHNRLSPTIDFGKNWYNVPCSTQYWNSVNPVFTLLEKEHKKGTLFSEIKNKDNVIYKPLVEAFINEISKQYKTHPELPQKLVEYILSKYDFYKVISLDSKQITQVQSFNLHNTLNKPSKKQKPKILVPKALLPTRIIRLDFFPNRNNTAEMYLDRGWCFTFRIHNGDKIAISSLKFDIKVVGMPAEILTLNCMWR